MSRHKSTPKKKRKLSHPKKVGPVRRRNSKPRKLRNAQSKKRSRITRLKPSSRKHTPVRRKKLVTVRRRRAITDPRIARGLGIMRREGVSASEAAHDQGIKLKTFVKGAGRSLYRSGRGKPWKARSEDQLRFSMSVLTPKGRVAVIVRNSRERKLLHDYETAVNMFRGAEDGADEELKKFAGKRVGGHELVTDTNVLIELEEADELDFDSLYTPPGGKS
jgi:hypothetical protein